MLPLPSTRQIQFLLALKKEGSFHKAARACGVTQSTISAAIRETETVLGAALLDRGNPRKPVFTALGLEILDAGADIIARLSDIAERARRSQTLLSTPLRIGIIPTIAPYLLPRILRPLQQHFPQLTLHLHEMHSAELVQAISNGTLDYGVMAFPYPATGLQHFPLVAERFFCAAPRGLFKSHTIVTPEMIGQHRILLLSDGHCLRNHVLAACNISKTLPQDDDVSATSLSTLIQLVAEGYGITLLPQMVVHHKTLPAGIDILPIENAPTREIGGVWRQKSAIGKDALALSLAVYRLIQGGAIDDDRLNPDLSAFRHIIASPHRE